jgi:outer membrane protein
MRTLRHLLIAAGLLAIFAAPALAYEPGTWIYRSGVGVVQPKNDNWRGELLDLPVAIDVDSGTSMTLNLTYMFSENWGFDVLGSLPFKHDIDATISGSELGTVNVGETKHLPPTFSIQYHFAPDATFQPYLGVGVNWTTFFNTKASSTAIEVLGIDDIELDDSIGPAAQIGGDWKINDHWLLNIDVRYIDIATETKLVGVGFGDDPDSVGKLSIGDAQIDPWVYAINLGYRF